MKIYLNGKIQDCKKLVDITELGFLFGWGVFETVRIYQGKPAFLSQHIQRLKSGCKKMLLSFPEVSFKNILRILLEQNKLTDAHCRITIFKKRSKSGALITVAPFTQYTTDDYRKGYKAIVVPFVNYSKDHFIGVKSISYAANIIARTIAEKNNKQEALFFNESGLLTEGSRSNLFFVKANRLCTPSVQCGLLNGITRQQVIKIVRDRKIRIRIAQFKLKDLLSSTEAFLTSSLMEIMPLVEVNGKSIRNKKPGEMTRYIHALYRAKIK